jgi:hypothetical protein
MPYSDPSSTNTFVPDWEATGQLVQFIRDPKKFPINDIVAFRNALKPVGLYVAFESEQAIRVPTKEQFSWPDGMPRPEGNNNLMGFEYRGYKTERMDIPFTLGNRTRANCPWNIVGAHSSMSLSQYMTLITWDCFGFLQEDANWETAAGVDHYDTAVALGEGFWDEGSVEFPYMQRGLYEAFQRIKDDTFSVVSKDDVRLVLGVEAARKIRTSQEILAYIKGSQFAMQQIRGEIANRNQDFDLPERLFGFEVVILDSQRVTSLKNANRTYDREYIMDPNTALLMSKQEALPGDYVSDSGSIPNFSTFQVFCYVGEDGKNTADGRETGGFPFTVETFEDTINRRMSGHVVGDWGLEMVAPESGYKINQILSGTDDL